ncbi:MAG TPA: DUF2071 domain-containing protein [Chthoniobacteraceae bacterium]|jgi:uncharacterized protein YqjF (DUF2071 family)|nr:DUF2071 domain-containing protein [Chthoniobacteraceae bacterium]
MSHAAAFEDDRPPRALTAAASARWRPAFVADWAEATFVHFAVEPRRLQPFVPFELDLHEGRAYVSLVAFTMRHMRPARLDSPAGELLLRAIMPCRFLNVRTYVRAGGGDGIYFLGEWLSQWMNIPFGPALYGLPYRPGHLCFARDPETRSVDVDVRGLRGGRLTFRSRSDAAAPLTAAAPRSCDAFLLERYFAFTMRRGRPLVFEVEHAPWAQTAADISMDETSLLSATGDWISHARLVGAHFTPGALGVRMGAPKALRRAPGRSAFLG